jgi:hypothetical protein
MAEETIYYRRNLPHIQPAQGYYFITFRLVDTIPHTVLKELIERRNREEQIVLKQLKDPELHNALYQLQKNISDIMILGWIVVCKANTG